MTAPMFAGLTDEVTRFEAMIREAGTGDTGTLKLGNVEFWFDTEGPWAGQLSFSLPTAQWDVPAVIQDLTAKLMEAAQ